MIYTKFDCSGEDLKKKNQCIFTLLLLSPQGKDVPLHLKNLESPPLKYDLCQVWSNSPSGSGEEVENVKVYRQSDDGQRATLSFQLR
jgi:hypothetical protein